MLREPLFYCRDRKSAHLFITIFCIQNLRDILLTMTDTHLYAKLLMDMFCQVLGRIDAAVLTARATKTEHERGEATLQVTTHMIVGQFIDRIQEG